MIIIAQYINEQYGTTGRVERLQPDWPPLFGLIPLCVWLHLCLIGGRPLSQRCVVGIQLMNFDHHHSSGLHDIDIQVVRYDI